MHFDCPTDHSLRQFIKFHLRVLRGAQNCFTTTAGFPATTIFGLTLLVTTEPAATTALSPMVTPFKITAFIPIQTLSAIFTGAVFNLGRAGRSLKYGARACASMRRWAGSSG